jgi:chromosomal replication initiation ATPase DnaA
MINAVRYDRVLDFRERYRQLPDILAVDDVAALERDPDALAGFLDRLESRPT